MLEHHDLEYPFPDAQWLGLALFGRSTTEEAGNLLAYIAGQKPGITRDRMMDTVILISERLATEHHLCLLAVHYKIWACGPVQEDLFVDLSSDNLYIMGDYLRKEHSEKGDIFFTKVKPDITVFREVKQRVIRDVVAETADLPDSELRRMVVGPGSYWEKESARIGYLKAFRLGICATSDKDFDIARMIEDWEDREAYYEDWQRNEEAVPF